MGRCVWVIKGNLEFEYRYAFGAQCSNLGGLLESASFAKVYSGEDGEVVYVYGEKDKILKELEEKLEDEVVCPYCASDECSKYTKRMLERLYDAVKEFDGDVVDAWLFSEY